MFDMFKSLLTGGAGTASISANELKQRLSTSDKPVLLDVRQPQEHKTRNLPGSILIPLGELQSRMKELEKHKDREIVVYCASGGRSSSACGILSQAGYSVRNLSGGMMGW
jgi:rhodanese-related sulfurtransferase